MPHHYDVYRITLTANTYRNELLSAMTATVKVWKLRPVDDITSRPLPLGMLLADLEQVTGLAHVELAEQADSVASR